MKKTRVGSERETGETKQREEEGDGQVTVDLARVGQRERVARLRSRGSRGGRERWRREEGRRREEETLGVAAGLYRGAGRAGLDVRELTGRALCVGSEGDGGETEQVAVWALGWAGWGEKHVGCGVCYWAALPFSPHLFSLVLQAE